VGSILGNVQQQSYLKHAILKSPSILAVTGPSHLGKFTSISEELDGQNALFVSSDINGAREARSFLANAPLCGNISYVVMDEADSLSDPARDALLKLCEEPPSYGSVIFIVRDFSSLPASFQSRITQRIQWCILDNEQMRQFALSTYGSINEKILSISMGRPGMYHHIHTNNTLLDLYDAAVDVIHHPGLRDSKPSIFSHMEPGPSVERDLVAHVCVAAGIMNPIQKSKHMMKFASDITKFTSTNVSIFWERMCLCSMM
jgi:hypothetical protein